MTEAEFAIRHKAAQFLLMNVMPTHQAEIHSLNCAHRGQFLPILAADSASLSRKLKTSDMTCNILYPNSNSKKATIRGEKSASFWNTCFGNIRFIFDVR